MGTRMARNLLDAGHAVTVYNRSDGPAEALVEAGAARAATPRAAAVASTLVVAMVTDDAASRAVWLGDEGAVCGLCEGAVAAESSTLTPAWVRSLGDAVAEAGATLVDAPVLGTRPQAEAGELAYLVGGPPEAVTRLRPVTDVLGAAVHHMGPLGHGAATKLAVNAFFGIQAAALGELLGLLRAAGVDEDAAAETLASLPVTSPKAKVLLRLMHERDFAPMFPIDLVAKDFRYACEVAEAAGAEVPTTDAVRAVFARAQAEGFGADNITGVARLFLESDA
jgi:3-hydroxyisobutyrate dehydrogenase-like beta-hydroxyacid dehydrogenase